jgi:hypothetical protein
MRLLLLLLRSKLLAVSSLYSLPPFSLLIPPLTVEIFMTTLSPQTTLAPQLMIEQLISFKNALKMARRWRWKVIIAKRKKEGRKTMGD